MASDSAAIWNSGSGNCGLSVSLRPPFRFASDVAGGPVSENSPSCAVSGSPLPGCRSILNFAPKTM